VTPEAAVIRSLEFAAVTGFRPLELDIHLPESPPPWPAVLYLHGGGWRLGSRRMPSPPYRSWNPGLFRRVAAAGIAVVSADYRLSGEALFPAQLDDVRQALAWIGSHGEEHGLDPGRVMLWGDSAGGHLAALAALDTEPASVPASGARPAVRAVVNWYPITDLTALQEDALAVGGEPHDTPDARETALLGAPIQDIPDLARRASPVAHVRPGAPPFLLVHGTGDLAAPYAQSLRLRDALTGAGNEVTLSTIDGPGHMWQGADTAQLTNILNTTISFLTHHAFRT
jgi:acetyl esterase/lipase